MTLTELADRVERLTGRCMETDLAIWRAVRKCRPSAEELKHERGWVEGFTIVWIDSPIHYGGYCLGTKKINYTASLDAAMTLVPPNHRWLMNGPDVDGAGDDIKPCAAVMPYGVSLFLPSDTHQAATPVLAFLSAVLHARASMEGQHGR